LIKKIIGILLIGVMLINTTSVVFLQNQKSWIKREIKHRILKGIDKKDLVLLNFDSSSKNSIKWDGKDEFEFKGQKYDVVDTEIHQNSISYWCYADHKESKLDRKINKLLSFAVEHHQRHRESSKRMIKFYKSFYFSTPKTLNYFINSNTGELQFYQNLYQSIDMIISTPPPKRMLS